MYLWHVLSRNEQELIHRVYNTQSNANSIGDCVRLAEEDKKEYGIKLSDNDVQSVSQNVFKKFARKKVKIKHLECLNNWKKKHTKSTHLDCTDHKDG